MGLFFAHFFFINSCLKKHKTNYIFLIFSKGSSLFKNVLLISSNNCVDVSFSFSFSFFFVSIHERIKSKHRNKNISHRHKNIKKELEVNKTTLVFRSNFSLFSYSSKQLVPMLFLSLSVFNRERESQIEGLALSFITITIMFGLTLFYCVLPKKEKLTIKIHFKKNSNR